MASTGAVRSRDLKPKRSAPAVAPTGAVRIRDPRPKRGHLRRNGTRRTSGTGPAERESSRTASSIRQSTSAAFAAGATHGVAAPAEVRLDFATYSPVSLLLKDKGWLEEDLAADGISVRWVQSLGSNKALEFLNAGSIDFGSTAGSSALIARIDGNPIKAVYVYSRPEWAALVTRPDTGIRTVADLKGRRVAATRGTDPHAFLVRSLAAEGLGERDVSLVLLQHADGKAALIRGDVDAWAGLDPMMAAAELEDGAVLFKRDRAFNSGGVLNVRETFAAENPALVKRVLAAYERARLHATAHPDELAASLAAAARLPDRVVARQLERTDISRSTMDDSQVEAIRAAGHALQEAGVIAAEADVEAATAALVERSFTTATN